FNFTSGGSIVQSFINSCTGEWFNGFSSNEIDINTITVKDLLGEYDMVLGIAPTAWKYNGMVNPDSFLYLPGFLASFGIAFCFIIASINLARRIYEIVLIYISMPLAFSTLPLDNGNRLKKWTGFLMQRILIGYGTIFSFNVFLLVMPYLSSIHLDSLSDLGNSLFTLIVIVSGASLIPAGQSIFTKIFAESDAGLGYGKEAVTNTKRNAVMMHRDMKMSARSLFK
ncbi:MAG: hypothetical protein K5765_00010, partial [Clostridia bacterium]|nr:hypothetical protein [Clostridia bacterium]